MLELGKPVPPFSVKDERDEIVTEKILIGKWTVLYFYPKDDTSGCTAEACSLRDTIPHFSLKNAQVLGVSADSSKSHQKFKTKYNLNFPLLVDTDHTLASLFDTWVEKSMYGKKYMGMERSTFIIDPEGIIRGIYRKVKPENHADFIAQKLADLQEV